MTRSKDLPKNEKDYRDNEIIYDGHTEYFIETDAAGIFAIKLSDKPPGHFPVPLKEGDYLRIFLDDQHNQPMIGGFLVNEDRRHTVDINVTPLCLLLTEINETSLDKYFAQNMADLFEHDRGAPAGIIYSGELQKIFLEQLPMFVTRAKQSRVMFHSPDQP